MRRTRGSLLPLFFLFCPAALAARELALVPGQSQVLTVEKPQKVAIGDPEVADVTTVSDFELLVNARKPGRTTLVIWRKDGKKEVLDVSVAEKRLEKTMVEVQVEVMELSQSNSDEFGVSWVNDSRKGLGLAESQTSYPVDPLKLGTVLRSGLLADLEALTSRGRVKILARPKLLSISGQEASFHSGGEVPVVVQADNARGGYTIHVEWKPYGVELKMKPEADPLGSVNVKLRAEVSSLDYLNAVILNGLRVPAIRNRWVDDEVHVERGGTLVVAGLMDENLEKSYKGIPVLSWIPILGHLFRTTRNQKSSTELVIFVTPRVL